MERSFKTKEEAETKAKEMGCGVSRTRKIERRYVFMPCENHTRD